MSADPVTISRDHALTLVALVVELERRTGEGSFGQVIVRTAYGALMGAVTPTTYADRQAIQERRDAIARLLVGES